MDYSALRQKYVYNTTRWHKLRLWHITQHPICEVCEKNLGEDVHHVKSFLVNGKIDLNLAFSDTNLLTVCKKCHGEIHNKGKNKYNGKNVAKYAN